MSDKIKPSDNQSNIQNPNKGTPGTNRQYDQKQGNRGKQMNPNQGRKGGKNKQIGQTLLRVSNQTDLARSR
jgi:hypothetical protein